MFAVGWGKDNPPGGPLAVAPVRTWCCGTSADKPHTPGCRFEPVGPLDYGRAVAVIQAESVEPWHGQAAQSIDPVQPDPRRPAPVDVRAQSRARASQVAYEHFPVVEAAMLFGRDHPVVRITCGCMQPMKVWSNEDGDHLRAVYAAWAQHLAETLVP